MAQQKLYTEEQVRDMLEDMNYLSLRGIDYYMSEMTPIKLPSDEDRINKFNAFISTEIALKFLTKEQGERLKWYYETYLNL